MNKEKLAKFITNHFRILVTITYGMTILAGISFCYYFLPILLNYGPGSINTDFDRAFSGGLTYFLQFVLIFISVFSVGYIAIYMQTKDFKNINKYLKNVDTSDEAKSKLERIKTKCITIPLYLFLYTALLPTIGLLIVFIMLGFTSIADFKVLLIVAITALLISSLEYIILKNLFKSVLIRINNTDKIKSTKLSLTKTLIMQLFPLIIVIISYTFLITYSVNMEDKSKILKEHYTYAVEEIMNSSNATTINELEKDLNSINFISSNDEVFLIDSNREFYKL